MLACHCCPLCIALRSGGMAAARGVFCMFLIRSFFSAATTLANGSDDCIHATHGNW